MPHRPHLTHKAAPGERLLLVVGLLIFFALAVGAAVDKAPTIDEPSHVTRGIVLSQTGELSLQVGHTPLSHRLMGLLMPTEPTLADVTTLAAWPTRDRLAIADELLWQGAAVDRVIFLARLPIIWTGVLLGAVVALWTAAVVRRGHGGAAVWPALGVVMALFASSPNLLAAAALSTTDMVSTATYFAAVAAWWFYWQRPGRRRLLAAGALLGLALAAKLTGVLIVPLLLPLAYVYGYRGRRDWLRPALVWLAALAIGGLTLWVVYAFQLRPFPLAAYRQSWSDVLNHVSAGHQAFFLGEISAGGWWLYFPVSLLLKTPLSLLLLYAAALIGLARARAWRIGAFLLLPVGAILAAAVTSRLNIGYRHVLPAIPFALVTVGLGIPALWRRRAGRWAVGAAAVWALGAAVWIHPHHLAYFNELVGGPAHGYRYLGDSNIDWGQDLKGLAAYAAGHDDVYMSYGGAADPAAYGLTQPPLAGPEGSGRADFHPANPATGTYALSAGHVQGLLPEADLYDWFRRREPDGFIGYSILLYDVTAQPGTWVARCASPAPLLSAEEAARLVGLVGGRDVTFDCQSAWVFPEDAGPGWYVLPIQDEPWWINSWLYSGRVFKVYRHEANQFGPAYEVYYWLGATYPEASMLGVPYNEPFIAGAAEMSNYATRSNEWATLWHVVKPTTDPLSIQAHLYTGNNAPQVADGLGFTSDQWRPDDWFIQRHVFTTPGNIMETGLYNYVTLETVAGPVRLPARSP